MALPKALVYLASDVKSPELKSYINVYMRKGLRLRFSFDLCEQNAKW